MTHGVRSTRPPRQWMGLLAAAGVVVLFVGFVLVSKLGLGRALDPMDLAAIRFAVAGTLMAPVVFKHRLMGLRLGQAGLLAGSGGLGFALLAYWGMSLAPANHGSALIHGTLPLTTALVVGLVAGVQPTRLQRWSLGAVSLGVVAFLATSLSRTGAAPLTGDLLLLAASLAWSAYGVLLRRWGARPFATSALTAVLSAMVFLPLYGLLGAGHLGAAPLQEVLWQAVFQGVFIGVGSILVYSTSVAINGASVTALAASAVPVLTAVGAWLLLDERLAAGETVGLVMVTAGVALGTISQAKPHQGAA